MIRLKATLLALSGALAWIAGVDAVDSKSKVRPNILFILADDLGWKDLSNEGSKYYESPYIDRIAREGMKFTR